MPAQVFTTSKKATSEGLLRILLIFFTLVLPSLLLLAGVVYYYQMSQNEETATSELEFTDENLAVVFPSQIVEDKNRYKDKQLVVRGKVVMAPAICERGKCPESDPCCGCQAERDLVVTDANSGLFRQANWQLRVLEKSGQAICRRVLGSCEYDCDDWQPEAVYDIAGTFYADPPPRGSAWRMFLEFYFLADEKVLVQPARRGGVAEKILQAMQDLLERVRYSGSYVLQD